MSEYQYYEFQAVDRPLTKEEIGEVRALSTRATITPNRFVNVYNWGDFQGNPRRLMERYYDAFLCEANWGTRQLMLRFPKEVLDLETIERYCLEGECLQLHQTDEGAILELRTAEDDDGGGGWIAIEDSEAWLPRLLPIREEILDGDLRALYLGWLLCAQSEILDDDRVEPPLPPGLRSLSPAQQALAKFVQIDQDLLAVAAERSAGLVATGWRVSITSAGSALFLPPKRTRSCCGSSKGRIPTCAPGSGIAFGSADDRSSREPRPR